MRTFTIHLLLAALAGLAASCTNPQTPSAGKPEAADEKNTAVLTSGGKGVLRLAIPAGAQTFDKDEMLIVAQGKGHCRFYVWTVKNARTLDEAAPRVGEVIKSEFIEFKLTGTKDLTIGGAPARMLAGTGKEADDSDPGLAEVVLFAAGQNVFAACVHGEELLPAARDLMMTAIHSARLP
ncbi:MAG: hypothetical protein NT031_20385 [Planctomycetota bacterium]|nr:hypothetical protein [Planctomycetota bacterium]